MKGLIKLILKRFQYSSLELKPVVIKTNIRK